MGFLGSRDAAVDLTWYSAHPCFNAHALIRFGEHSLKICVVEIFSYDEEALWVSVG